MDTFKIYSNYLLFSFSYYMESIVLLIVNVFVVLVFGELGYNQKRRESNLAEEFYI